MELGKEEDGKEKAGPKYLSEEVDVHFILQLATHAFQPHEAFSRAPVCTCAHSLKCI